jgi:hypothetical protein
MNLEPHIRHLHGPEDVAYEPDELVVVCLVRDGRPYVRSFVEHYLSLGVKHMFFLDNGSADGTVEALKEHDEVSVLRSDLPFKEYKVLFKRYLIDRFGKKQRWCLYADMDELFDYPYSDVVGLGSLLGYLTERSYTAVAAQMLDMFAEEPLSGRGGNLPDEPLKERHRFYDLSNISRKNIKELPRRLRDNKLESDEIEFFRGGIRETIFGDVSFLTKFPLVFSDGRIEPFVGANHSVDNARIADLTCVLFHYKFLGEHFHKQAAQAVQEGQYWNNSFQYKNYLKVLDRNPTLRVKQESAREIESVNDLVENGFLVVSGEYMTLVYDQEQYKGAYRAPLQGGPKNEAVALNRAKAEAKVQSLRAQRLERHLQKLQEQNLSLERLREQHQREVEKLSGHLAKAREKNRNCMRQLQNIQGSRAWRVLNKLGRLKVKALTRLGS